MIDQVFLEAKLFTKIMRSNLDRRLADFMSCLRNGKHLFFNDGNREVRMLAQQLSCEGEPGQAAAQYGDVKMVCRVFFVFGDHECIGFVSGVSSASMNRESSVIQYRFFWNG